jgi:hypothetical protein
MEETETEAEVKVKTERWPLIRQAIVFQFKLGLDALRDILMSPVSLVLVVVDVIMANHHQHSYFLRLMRLGKQSDHWINLFGGGLSKDETSNNEETVNNNVDYWFSRIEAVIKEQQVDGKLSQSGREKLQQYFRKVSQTLDKTESNDSDKG